MNSNYSKQNGKSQANQANEPNKNAFSGLRDVGQAYDILNRYRRENSEKTEEIERLLNDLLDALFSCQDSLTGGADDFHNFTVSISKISNDNRSALQIAEEGLKLHGDNTDLLADAYNRHPQAFTFLRLLFDEEWRLALCEGRKAKACTEASIR